MTLAYLGDSGIVLLAGDEQRQYDADGVWWQWNGNEPWSPGPDPKKVTGDNANDHGSWDATKYYASRSYEIQGLAHAPTHEALHRAKERFMTAIGLSIDLRVIEPGFDRRGNFRRDGQPLWAEASQLIGRFSAPIWAKDPRAYSTSERSASSLFPSSTGGLVWPATWPATWDATVVNGQMQMFNAGNDTAYPVYRIDGPVASPVIVNPVTGQAMHFDLTLDDGQWLTVDTRTHQVLADGDPNASRRDTFWGDWFGLAPGANTILFGGASSGVGTQISATWHDTFI